MSGHAVTEGSLFHVLLYLVAFGRHFAVMVIANFLPLIWAQTVLGGDVFGRHAVSWQDNSIAS